MTQLDNKPKPGVLGIESQTLVKELLNVEPNQTVEYERLSELIGLSVRSTKNIKGYGYLQTALKTVQKEYAIVFKTINNVGLKRIDDPEEFEEIGEKVIKHTRKQGKKAFSKLSCANTEIMNTDQKIKHNSLMTITNLFTSVCEKRNVRKIENAVETKMDRLSFQKSLEAFKN